MTTTALAVELALSVLAGARHTGATGIARLLCGYEARDGKTIDERLAEKRKREPNKPGGGQQ